MKRILPLSELQFCNEGKKPTGRQRQELRFGLYG